MPQQNQLNLEQIRQQFKAIFGKEMHLKRRHSFADAAMGLMNSNSLRLHALGEGLASAKNLISVSTRSLSCQRCP